MPQHGQRLSWVPFSALAVLLHFLNSIALLLQLNVIRRTGEQQTVNARRDLD